MGHVFRNRSKPPAHDKAHAAGTERAERVGRGDGEVAVPGEGQGAEQCSHGAGRAGGQRARVWSVGAWSRTAGGAGDPARPSAAGLPARETRGEPLAGAENLQWGHEWCASGAVGRLFNGRGAGEWRQARRTPEEAVHHGRRFGGKARGQSPLGSLHARTAGGRNYARPGREKLLGMSRARLQRIRTNNTEKE